MSDVGGISFDIVRGLPQLLRAETDLWRVPGLDGYGAQITGNADGEFEIVTVAYVADSDTADALINSSNALQGTVTTMTDDWGDSYTAVLVRSVDTRGPGMKMPILKDGTPQVRVTIRWAMVTVSF